MREVARRLRHMCRMDSCGMIGVNTWQLGGTGASFPQLCVGDTRFGVASKMTIGTYTEYSDRLVVSGNIQASAYNSLSDISLKDGIQNADEDDCITMLRNIQAKTYVRNDIENTDRRIGFIAQDVTIKTPANFLP